jgi:predicted metal-binding membrane protein
MATHFDLRKPFVAVFAALVVLAWLGLWLWDRSPYGRFLSHEELGHSAERDGLLLVLFVAGWSLMMIAMMLPTTLLLVALFHGLTRRRPDRPLLVALLLAGYLGIWTLFGGIVHLGDQRLHETMHYIPWLAERA